VRPPEVAAAIGAAKSIVSALGLAVDDATVLHNSNKLTLRLMPCDLVARVAPVQAQAAQFEVDLAQQLMAAGSPVASLDPRVDARPYPADKFMITLLTHYEQHAASIPPVDYANALARLHADMRNVQIDAPDFTDRVAEAQQLVVDRDRTPALGDDDRVLLAQTLRTLGQRVRERARMQLLHGEPHPGNLLNTTNGPRFIDLETCCHGPVEFDVAHAPEAVGELYPNVDRELLRDCRILVLAMVTTWRWDHNDQFPDGTRLGKEWLGRLRAALA
jgi:aminoglycoside phosphotransferase (APT) family kinase protein